MAKFWRITVRARLACPSCGGDLKKQAPIATHTWRISKRTLFTCPYCAAKIVNRFESIDVGLATGFTSGLALSVWTTGKTIFPILLGLTAFRFLVGKVVPKYVMAEV